MKPYRRFITSSVAFTFIFVGITGIIFKFFFSNHLLVDLHGWLGVIMVAAAILHITQNWRSLLSYLRDRRVYGLLIPIVAVIVFVTVQQMEASPRIAPREVIFKLSQGHADDVARVFGKDADTLVASMKRDGLHVESKNQTIQELAQQNQIPPERILLYFVK